jgi:hypothetical protein
MPSWSPSTPLRRLADARCDTPGCAAETEDDPEFGIGALSCAANQLAWKISRARISAGDTDEFSRSARIWAESNKISVGSPPEILDRHGKLAIENNEKVEYA